MKELMSGDEVRIFLHISKRKMKFLIENNYIPTTDTGKKTHRYMIQLSDAVALGEKLKNRPDEFTELVGKFSSREKQRIKPIIEPTEENLAAYREYLSRLWKNYPDALPLKTTAALLGYHEQRVRAMINSGRLLGAVIIGRLYASKDSVIKYCVKRGFEVGDDWSEETKALAVGFAEKEKRRAQKKKHL